MIPLFLASIFLFAACQMWRVAYRAGYRQAENDARTVWIIRVTRAKRDALTVGRIRGIAEMISKQTN